MGSQFKCVAYLENRKAPISNRVLLNMYN